MDEQHRANISAALTGRTKSAEHRAAIGQSVSRALRWPAGPDGVTRCPCHGEPAKKRPSGGNECAVRKRERNAARYTDTQQSAEVGRA